MNVLKPGDRMIGVLPFFHIYGMVLILNLALYRGVPLVTIPRFELERVSADRCRTTRSPAWIWCPPRILALAKHPVVDNQGL